MQNQETFSREKLLEWIGGDPIREATIAKRVPVKLSTLQKIKSGGFIPSERLGKAINNVMNERTKK